MCVNLTPSPPQYLRATMSALAGAPAPPAATEELPEEVPWVPRMDAIRQAQENGVAAMESAFGAIASKQQSSFTRLRRQVDTIMAWKLQVTEKDRKTAARREVARREAATAAERSKLAGDPGNTHAAAAVTTTESAAIIAPADQNEAASLDLVAGDSDDWDETPEERVEQGVCGVERHTAVMCVCVCVTLRRSVVLACRSKIDFLLIVTVIHTANVCGTTTVGGNLLRHITYTCS